MARATVNRVRDLPGGEPFAARRVVRLIARLWHLLQIVSDGASVGVLEMARGVDDHLCHGAMHDGAFAFSLLQVRGDAGFTPCGQTALPGSQVQGRPLSILLWADLRSGERRVGK